MKTKLIVWMLTSVLVVSLCACATQVPTVDSNALGTIVAQNVQLTQLAGTLTAVVAQQSATPEVTNTSSFTKTPRPSPTITLTPTPLTGLWLTFDQDTNCRYGPGTSYGISATIGAGERLQAIAQSEDGEFYYVRYFDTSNHYCWVWKQTAYQSGTTNIVPVYTVQPTNTPTITPTSDAGFTVKYNSLQTCSSEYSLLLTVTNTGYLTWQSIKIVIVDATAGVTDTHTSNKFTGYSGCSISQDQADLTTGEYGLVSNYSPGQFTYDPTGHTLNVAVSLYSEDGNTGTVMTKSFTFTP